MWKVAQSHYEELHRLGIDDMDVLALLRSTWAVVADDDGQKKPLSFGRIKIGTKTGSCGKIRWSHQMAPRYYVSLLVFVFRKVRAR